MLHDSLSALVDRQHRFLKNAIRWLFSLAGVFWFAIWLATDAIARHPNLRSTHYGIYMLLLTLWGFSAMRERKRLQVVVAAANARGCAPKDVTASDLQADGALSAFTLFTPRGDMRRAWIPSAFITGLLIASTMLLLLQYSRLVF
jgi:hypothetical protein